uniref:Uncharacterized protein n=1 Tax=Arundo donax TaxID=35708 RepID=A0A0A8Z2L8_ARUDO
MMENSFFVGKLLTTYIIALFFYQIQIFFSLKCYLHF